MQNSLRRLPRRAEHKSNAYFCCQQRRTYRVRLQRWLPSKPTIYSHARVKLQQTSRRSLLDIAVRRAARQAARAQSTENTRSDHEPGPFVNNAPGSAAQVSSPEQDDKKLTIPTILTLLRLLALPILIAVWYKKPEPAGGLTAGIFAVASATDYIDGYVARTWDMKSAFGAFLDPVVDKLLVAAVLILLSTRPIPLGPYAGNTAILPIISTVIITREITMSALREWAATRSKEAYASVAVSKWGKYKTGLQMVGLTILLYGYKAATTEMAEKAIVYGLPVTGLAAIVTILSFADYFWKLWSKL